MALSSEEDGPALVQTPRCPRRGMEEEAYEVSAEFNCAEIMEVG